MKIKKGHQESNLGGHSFFVLKSLLNTSINKKPFFISPVVNYNNVAQTDIAPASGRSKNCPSREEVRQDFSNYIKTFYNRLTVTGTMITFHQLCLSGNI